MKAQTLLQRHHPEPFGWVDSAVFLTPLAIVCVLILLARWSGWLA